MDEPAGSSDYPGTGAADAPGTRGDRVLVVMGSRSDLPVMQRAVDMLDAMGIDCEVHISSAHRAPERTMQLARSARQQGFGAIIAGAGLAAHLPGVLAACTTLPVIGVPLASGALNGTDALHAIVQMPTGVPVATVAIGGAANAGLLAAQVIAATRPDVDARLELHRARMLVEVEHHDEDLQRTRREDAARPPQPLATST